MTCTSPKPPTMTLEGFRSRWITPLEWAYATVWQTCTKTDRKRGRSSAGSSRASSSAARVRPLTSFMVKKGRPSAKAPSS